MSTRDRCVRRDVRAGVGNDLGNFSRLSSFCHAFCRLSPPCEGLYTRSIVCPTDTRCCLYVGIKQLKRPGPQYTARKGGVTCTDPPGLSPPPPLRLASLLPAAPPQPISSLVGRTRTDVVPSRYFTFLTLTPTLPSQFQGQMNEEMNQRGFQ